MLSPHNKNNKRFFKKHLTKIKILAMFKRGQKREVVMNAVKLLQEIKVDLQDELEFLRSLESAKNEAPKPEPDGWKDEMGYWHPNYKPGTGPMFWATNPLGKR